MREAETRFQEGLTLYSQGSINEARVKLVQAYAVLGRTNILWNLAVAEFYSSRFLESVRHMRTFVRATDAEPNDVALAKKQFLPQLEKQTGRVEIHAPRGSTIAVDGDEFGPAPLEDAVDVLPGRHMVLARTPSGNATVAVTVHAGQTVPANVGDANDATVRPANTASESSSDKPEGSSTARNVTVIALGAGAAVAAGVGLVFALSSNGHSDDADELKTKLRASGGDSACGAGATNPDCTAFRDANDARDSDMGIATGFFIGAGVLAVGAGLTYLLWPSGGSKVSAQSSKLTFHF
jgi:hypothetical protein